MAEYFVDTSALVKYYVSDTGSTWVDSIIAPTHGNEIYIQRLTEVELTAAVIRRRNMGSISTADAATAHADFAFDIDNEFLVTEISNEILVSAVQLVKQHGLRAYNALQLAVANAVNERQTALNMSHVVFLSADQQLNAAPIAEGVSVEIPNDYP